ncbi:MAG: very short patch repair endonuclease [Gammaproteobacteria bacterium]|nr:very short patch repair endonuclease [Gammaproteobacteria bacterium]
MGRVRAAGNRSTEGKLIAILKQHRLTGWRRKYPIFGKPDIVFPRNKVAVFADGCFWHACPKHAQIPASNRKFWRKKLEANKNRDKLVNRTIKNKGWKVLRFWECELKDERRLRRKLNRLGELLQDTRP